MNIFAIESSCDETAAAIVQDGVHEISSFLATSEELHRATGGVVPEVAARKQVEFIIPVLDHTLKSSGLSKDDIDALAVTVGPGLIGSLLVGVEAAKSLSLFWEKPLIPVNHLVGHIYANFVDAERLPEFPALVLIVSGGHTDLVLMRGHGDLEYIGGTLDDAAGEAFDKTARLLGIARYLGGVDLSKLAMTCEENDLAGKLPRPKIHDADFDFSFSGLKTAVLRLYENEKPPVDQIAAEFEAAVVELLVTKTIKAAKTLDVKSILLGGGVSANTSLRTQLKTAADAHNIPLHIPPLRLCGDNAIYIASAAYFNQNPKPLSEIHADSSLNIDSHL